MTSPGQTTAESREEEEQEEQQEPDWNLFHALQSTHGAMGDLRRMAQESPVKRDPRQELRDAERLVAGGKASGVKGVKEGLGRNLSVGTPSHVGTV
jgi:hypothetical protein